MKYAGMFISGKTMEYGSLRSHFVRWSGPPGEKMFSRQLERKFTPRKKIVSKHQKTVFGKATSKEIRKTYGNNILQKACPRR